MHIMTVLVGEILLARNKRNAHGQIHTELFQEKAQLIAQHRLTAWIKILYRSKQCEQ